MARPLRLEYPGAFYHVTSRGNEHRDIFRNNTDRRKFLSYLESASERYGAIIHVYCLMNNHYHLLLETPLGNLSRIMSHINGAYTSYFNSQKKRSGHLFQGRYKSILVEADSYAAVLSAYIHLNPVRAGIVSRPEEFPWSSYRVYGGEIERPDWLQTDLVLNLLSPVPNNAAIEYQTFVEGYLGQEFKSPLAAKGGAAFLGSDHFLEQLSDNHFSLELQETQRSLLGSQQWNPSIEQIVAKVDAAFSGDAKAARRAAIYLCHKLSGKTLRELGRFFGIGESGVSQACRRFSQDPSLNQKLKTLSEDLKTHFSDRGKEGRGARVVPLLTGPLETKILEVLNDFPEVFLSTLFGSAAKGRLTESSDVDIAVAARSCLSLETRGSLAVALSCALGREVDLIDLQAVSGLVLEQALCTGKIVKNTDHALYAGLLKRLWYNQADMMPYYRRILEKRSSQWLQP